MKIKKSKKNIKKRQNKDQKKTKILENCQSFKDWGSRVQGRGSKHNQQNTVKLREPQGVGSQSFTAGSKVLKNMAADVNCYKC